MKMNIVKTVIDYDSLKAEIRKYEAKYSKSPYVFMNHSTFEKIKEEHDLYSNVSEERMGTIVCFGSLVFFNKFLDFGEVEIR